MLCQIQDLADKWRVSLRQCDASACCLGLLNNGPLSRVFLVLIWVNSVLSFLSILMWLLNPSRELVCY